MLAGGLLAFDWTVAIMLFWLLASLFFIFSTSAQTCIKGKKSHGGVNDVRFSNRPVRVKRFQTIHQNSFEVTREHTLLFGIGTEALDGASLAARHRFCAHRHCGLGRCRCLELACPD
jgi:hypothetical protein